MEILKKEIVIEIYGDVFEGGYIQRDNKYRTIYYNRITTSSIKRLKSLVDEYSKNHKVICNYDRGFIQAHIVL